MQQTIPGNQKVSPQGKSKRATRINRDCLRCGNPLTGRQEKFCSDTCRWRRKNEVRLTVEKTAFILAENTLRLKPETFLRLCINELEAHGYEVKKK